MSSAGPGQAEAGQGNSSQESGRGLRGLPGFTTAAVVFVLVVLLGIGGTAIAKWNQSATVAIAVTAGAAATPSPTPSPTTPPPTTAPPTTPPAVSGNIVASPSIAVRPAKLVDSLDKCEATGKSGKFDFSWTVGQPTPDTSTAGLSYVAALIPSVAGAPALKPESQSGTTVTFRLDRAAFDTYTLRIQPFKGTAAGDPIYATFRFGGFDNYGCYNVRRIGPSPLGDFTLNTPDVPRPVAPGDNVFQLNWLPTQATSYLVSVRSTTSTYGAEFVAYTAAELIFPARVINDNKQPAASAPAYGEYLLRVIPMNGAVAGDPIYKKIVYKQWESTISYAAP